MARPTLKSSRRVRPTPSPHDDPEPVWTEDELAEPHECPGCGGLLFAQDFCDDDCRASYLADEGFMSVEEGPKPKDVLAGMDKPGSAKKPRLDDVPGPEDLVGLEGEERRRFVLHRAREQRLRDAKIREALSRDAGHLRCEVPRCGFDFREKYGPLGKEFAHVHHLTPLGDRAGGSTTRVSDLAIVCANCHAMIHRGGKSRGLKTLIPSRPTGNRTVRAGRARRSRA